MAREHVLVTGASAGIGLALARRFAANGSRLILVARREERLREIAAELGGDPVVIAADLADSGSAGALVETLRARSLDVDVLINNAGFGQRGGFDVLAPERSRRMVHLNVATLTELTRLLLPAMLERGSGGIMNVASTAAFQPGPNLAVYYATKAYVLSFSEALHEEVRERGVTVTCLCPGPTRTEFADVADMSDTFLFRAMTMSVDRVADAAMSGLRNSKAVVVPGVLNRLLVTSVRISPRWMTRRIVGRLQR